MHEQATIAKHISMHCLQKARSVFDESKSRKIRIFKMFMFLPPTLDRKEESNILAMSIFTLWMLVMNK